MSEINRGGKNQKKLATNLVLYLEWNFAWVFERSVNFSGDQTDFFFNHTPTAVFKYNWSLLVLQICAIIFLFQKRAVDLLCKG